MKQSVKGISQHLRVGITISPSQDKVIGQVLTQLLEQCPAQLILLSDTGGLLITMIGERKDINPISVASLIAADLAASQEISRQTGQYQNYQLVMREGERTNTFIVEAGRHLILFVQINSEVPLGWARLSIMKAARQVTEILKQIPENEDDQGSGLGNEKWSSEIDTSLDSLWTG